MGAIVLGVAFGALAAWSARGAVRHGATRSALVVLGVLGGGGLAALAFVGLGGGLEALALTLPAAAGLIAGSRRPPRLRGVRGEVPEVAIRRAAAPESKRSRRAA